MTGPGREKWQSSEQSLPSMLVHAGPARLIGENCAVGFGPKTPVQEHHRGYGPDVAVLNCGRLRCNIVTRSTIQVRCPARLERWSRAASDRHAKRADVRPRLDGRFQGLNRTGAEPRRLRLSDHGTGAEWAFTLPSNEPKYSTPSFTV